MNTNDGGVSKERFDRNIVPEFPILRVGCVEASVSLGIQISSEIAQPNVVSVVR